MNADEDYSWLTSFLFSLPLYSKCAWPPDVAQRLALVGGHQARLDGHCPYCRKSSTFTLAKKTTYTNLFGDEAVGVLLTQSTGFKLLSVTCARSDDHKLSYWYFLDRDGVLKVGQFPSLADIANDESSSYRDVLSKQNASELHKAIGLAAHGVGVGSFVYLRRVFERLVQDRFEEHKDAEGWKEADFRNLRMDERIAQLHKHLPFFLVENRKLYSILSQGIHELSEETCLAVFEPVKLSIKIILDEDRKNKQEAELRQATSEAIRKFTKP